MNNNRPLPKVVFVSTMAGSPWGGSEELWCRAARHLRGLGHDVGVSVFGWPQCPDAVRNLAAAGAEIEFRPRRRSMPGRLMEKIVQRISPTPIPRESMRWLERQAPDLVVISQGMPWDGLEWMTACRLLGLKYCPVIHANSEIWWPIDEWRESIVEGFPAAERVFFVSNANKNLMEAQCGFRFQNGEIVVNPCNVDAASDIPWPNEDGVARLACVGRVDPPAKGQDLLLQVLAMPKWRERPIHLNIYGCGPCQRSLEALQSMLNLRNVTFAGQVSDVARIWAENHALILPSRYEGLPLVIVEAMLCGRPVITTDVAGNAEYLKDGVTGFVASAPTVSHVDEALERAWSKREDWRTMGAAAGRDIRAALPTDTIETFTRKLLGLLS